MLNIRCTSAWLLLFLSLSCARSPGAPSAVEPSTASPASVVKLRLASTHWPPFTGPGDGPRIAIDLVTRALERAGYASSTDIVEEGSLTDVLKKGRFDGSAALWHSAEREQFLLYSNAYLENRIMLVGRKGSAVGARSVSELKGKKLGVVEGYAYGEELEASKDPQLVRAASTEDNLRALLRGEVDYALVEDLVIHHVLQQYPKQSREKLEVSPQPLLVRSLHLTVQKSRPDAQQIIDDFNRVLGDMLRDGSYNEVLGVAWLRADIDGDGRPELVTSGNKVGTQPPSDFYDLTTVTKSGAGVTSDDPGNARFVVKGVAYDSWSAVPDEHKTETDDLSAKPRTLRIEVFEF